VDLVAISAAARNASVIVLVNWSPKPATNLRVNISASAVPAWSSAERASGLPVAVSHDGAEATTFTLAELGDGDAIILRG